MILGIVLRNFKVYKNINVLPLSNGESFTGIIGTNGIGKSSILEALDCYFNGKPWIINVDNKGEESWIMPIIAVKRTELAENYRPIVDRFKEIILNKSDDSIKIKAPKASQEHIDALKAVIPEIYLNDEYSLLPICRTMNNGGTAKFSLGLFSSYRSYIFDQFISQKDNPDDASDEEIIEGLIKELYDFICKKYTYVYVPSDIPPDRFIAFENKELQMLMGEDLMNVVAKILPSKIISDISKQLKIVIENVSNSLQGYKFRVPGSNQPNLRPHKVYELIIDQFFSIRTLFKEADKGKDIPLANLSSGEKQQAIVRVITSLLSNYRVETGDLIVAIDEPESSLHISHCYEQFERILSISNICRQVFVTSHWYGFMPIATNGSILYLSNNHETPNYLYPADNFREKIVQQRKSTSNEFPVDITIKSTNDLVQSILSSVVMENNYNWIICEGSSDKIYLSSYLDELITNNNLRIIAACAASEVKKLYQYLQIAVEELKEEIRGRIFLITDTDKQLLKFDTNEKLESKLCCRRLLNRDNTTKLEPINSPNVSPATEIEDVLESSVYLETVRTFIEEEESLSFFKEAEIRNKISGVGFDLRDSQREIVDAFYNGNCGKNKNRFAEKYVSIIEERGRKESDFPDWIKELIAYFKNGKIPKK